MCRVCYFSCLLATVSYKRVPPPKSGKPAWYLFCFEREVCSSEQVTVLWREQYFSRGCVLLECLSLLELPGYCKATWNDSWVWQMSGTAGCVLDYPKSLDNAVIHHCPNYLCIDCRSLCDSTVMANYPGYLWYFLYSGLEELKKEKEKELEQKHTSESYILICS